jgi:DNA-binding NarL/FixJ family response regulator
MKNVKLLVTDDHPMIRNGVRLMLENQSSYNFQITEASNGEEALSKIKENNFDVLILDISMRKMGGIDVLKSLKQSKNKTPIIIQSMHDEAQIIKQTMDLGAKGYILKISDHDELLNAIEHALDDKPYFSREVNAIMFSTYASKKFHENKDGLTERELEIIDLIAKGLTNQQIADELFLSKRTVEGHKKRLYKKTNTHSTQTVILYAQKHKLID